MEEYKKMMVGHALEKGSLDDDFFTADIRVLERSVEESKADLSNTGGKGDGLILVSPN